jgi:molybdenum cofactor cytidylyltransferase
LSIDHEMRGATVAVILAAGGGSRFREGGDGTHKLLAEWRGRPLVWWAVSNALQAGLDATWVVTGSTSLEGFLPEGVEVLTNPAWAQGQATSLHVAINRAIDVGATAVVVGLGDQPLVQTSAWSAVATSTSPIAVATYEGRRRNPVRLGSEVWDLLPREGDTGARVVFDQRPDLVDEVPCDGDPVDIDTREDLARWS